MKHLYALLLLGICQFSFAQNDLPPTDFNSRSDLEPLLAPFYHGVASGDPLEDRVIIWTRITVTQSGPVDVNWKVGTDTTFSNVVASGTVTTDDSKDYTVKIDVTGLQPDTWYYYEFENDGRKSLIGRTRTAPVGGVDQLRLAIVSCQDYENGYFNVYDNIAQRNDIDVVVHLGDYIYEGGASSSLGREHEPPHEIITLEDYRTRYSQYRLDPDLRMAHQQYPFICVYDDHESSNNSWYGGAENHDPNNDGDWFVRKGNALQANQEWLPVRLPDPNDNTKIFRKIEFGDLLNLYMIDTRLYGRDEQGSGDDTSRRMIGQEQLDWLANQMDTATSQWNIIGQQVMMAQLYVFGNTVTTDAWDGYPRERENLYNEIINRGIENVVVLTGDIHTSWANDLPLDNYDNSDPNNITGSIGVEMITPSVTTQASPVPIPFNLIQSQNEHIHWANLDKKGFILLDVNENRAQGDWIFVSAINSTTYTPSVASSWYVNDGETFLREAQSESPSPSNYPYLAPLNPHNPVGVEEIPANTVLVGVYPNPFVSEVVAQFNLFEDEKLTIDVVDMTGKQVYSQDLGKVGSGLRYLKVDLSNLAKGTYTFRLVSQKGVVSRKIIKF